MERPIIILSIDTSCDETSSAVTINDRVLSNVISSQVALHKKWGGVVPVIAKRAHEERIDAVVKESLMRSARYLPYPHSKKSIINLVRYCNAIAVTIGPGLAPALEVGIRYAKKLAQKYKKPLIAVNHMEGHLLSSFAKNSQGKNLGKSVQPPFLGLLLSGGHTQLILMKDFGSYTIVGQTLDDALGEAYDKIAKLLDLGYPGGPIIEQLAKEGDQNSIPFPVPMRERNDCNFSYSGLKTAVRYHIESIRKKRLLEKQDICAIAASFQKVAVQSVVKKLTMAIDRTKPNAILLGGGVIANGYVRSVLRRTAREKKLPLCIPYTQKLFGDNAAMIGVCAYYHYLRNSFVDNLEHLDRKPTLSF